MCGIFGSIGSGKINIEEIKKISKILNHRGPDDEGFLFYNKKSIEIYGGHDTPRNVYDSKITYTPTMNVNDFNYEKFSNGIDNYVVFGQRRLSIIDVSASGHQPLSFSNGRYWITYNGEIYNFIEIKNELIAKGVIFTSNSDTEVILAAYDLWGTECLNKFNGMFSFAILDSHLNNIFLARDRFGVKPLYYRVNNNRLVFASEIKSFTGLSDWEPIGNTARILDFLIWNISDHTSETMFTGVFQIPAGHFVSLNLNDLNLNITPIQWYDINKVITFKESNYISGQICDILKDAVKLRLRSDVAVGSCLSGGLDSSSIVSIMGQLIDKENDNFNTFTATSDSLKFDESRFSKIVSNSAEASSNFVCPSAEKLFLDLDKIIWHQDEPFISTSIFAQWCVFELAKSKDTIVILDGQGADEILCGYHGYFGAFLAEKIKNLKFSSWVKSINKIKERSGISYYKQVGYTLAYLFPGLIKYFGKFDNKSYSNSNWLNPNVVKYNKIDPVRVLGGRSSSVRDMSVAQLTKTNLPMLLRYEDRNSMAFSIEARLPFLDYRFVEKSLQLDSELKIGNGITKEILRNEMIGIVPKEILERKDKMGFLTAEPIWMKSNFVLEFRKMLLDSAVLLKDFISLSPILNDFDEMVKNKSNFKNHYWRVICLANWARIFKVDKFQ